MESSDNTSDNSDTTKKYNWKGRYVSESVYNHRVALSNSAKKRKLSSLDTEPEPAIAIDFDLLIDTFSSEGEPGISALLSAEVDGKPRVSKSSKVIDTVVDFLSDIL